MKNGNFELEVCLAADEPKPLRQYGHDSRTFVEGKPGTPFCLVFRNHSSDRVEVVPSVDGLSVMDGKPATEDSEGYVVEPYRRVIIRGWRTSLKESSKFVFEKRGGSYAAATGQGESSCGVIGVLVYKEKEKEKPKYDSSILRRIRDLERQAQDRPFPVPHYIPYPVPAPAPQYPWQPTITWCATSGSPLGNQIHTAGLVRMVDEASAIHTSAQNSVVNCSVGSDTPDVTLTESPLCQTLYVNNLGTAWGEKQADEVREVKFTRGEQAGLMEIQYNDRAALEAAGIRFEAEPAVPKYPSAFKRSFCEPPRSDWADALREQREQRSPKK